MNDTLGCSPSQDASHHQDDSTFLGSGIPELNLHLPQLLGGGTTQMILNGGLVYLPFLYPSPCPVPVGKNEEIEHRIIIEYQCFVGFLFPPLFLPNHFNPPLKIARMRNGNHPNTCKYNPEVHQTPPTSIIL